MFLCINAILDACSPEKRQIERKFMGLVELIKRVVLQLVVL